MVNHAGMEASGEGIGLVKKVLMAMVVVAPSLAAADFHEVDSGTKYVVCMEACLVDGDMQKKKPGFPERLEACRQICEQYSTR